MNYTYDLNDRLSGSTFTETLYADGTYTPSEKITGGTNYRYDSNGNLLSEQKYTYGEGNVSSSMSVVGKGSENRLKIYNYDSFNQLTAYYDALSSASYTYNADGLRMSKTVNGTKTEFTWDGQNLAGEETGDSLNTYTYDVTGISSAVIDGVYRTYMKDTHGSVVGYYNATGERMKQYDYDAFGNRLEGSDPDPFGYCGEYYDSESGNIYLRARYYNSETGRFISEDPAKDGVNWYVYCSGNPIFFVDPSGYLNVGYDENGNWHDWDAEAYGADSDTYKILCDLTEIYNNGNENQKQYASDLANTIRESYAQGYEYKYLDKNEFITMLYNNAMELRNLKENFGIEISRADFINKVREGGEWDYKTKDGWRWPYEYNDIDGSTMEDWQRNTKKFIWFQPLGEMINGADVGNINYGFVALEVYNVEASLWGAGMLQKIQGRSDDSWTYSYGDDPEDTSFICVGMLLREGY